MEASAADGISNESGDEVANAEMVNSVERTVAGGGVAGWGRS